MAVNWANPAEDPLFVASGRLDRSHATHWDADAGQDEPMLILADVGRAERMNSRNLGSQLNHP